MQRSFKKTLNWKLPERLHNCANKTSREWFSSRLHTLQWISISKSEECRNINNLMASWISKNLKRNRKFAEVITFPSRIRTFWSVSKSRSARDPARYHVIQMLTTFEPILVYVNELFPSFQKHQFSVFQLNLEANCEAKLPVRLFRVLIFTFARSKKRRKSIENISPRQESRCCSRA